MSKLPGQSVSPQELDHLLYGSLLVLGLDITALEHKFKAPIALVGECLLYSTDHLQYSLPILSFLEHLNEKVEKVECFSILPDVIYLLIYLSVIYFICSSSLFVIWRVLLFPHTSVLFPSCRSLFPESTRDSEMQSYTSCLSAWTARRLPRPFVTAGHCWTRSTSHSSTRLHLSGTRACSR